MLDLEVFERSGAPPDPVPEHPGERFRVGGEQHPGFWVFPGQAHRTVDRHHRLPRAGRPRHLGRAAVVLVHDDALGRMQEDHPVLPVAEEGPLELLLGLDQEVAVAVAGVEEGVLDLHLGRKRNRLALEQAEDAFLHQRAQLGGELEHAVQVGQLHRRHVVPGDPQVVQVLLGVVGKRGVYLGFLHHHLLLDLDAHHLELLGLGVELRPVPLGPLVGLVVVIYVQENERAPLRKKNEPQVFTQPQRPKPVFQLLQLVPRHEQAGGEL